MDQEKERLIQKNKMLELDLEKSDIEYQEALLKIDELLNDRKYFLRHIDELCEEIDWLKAENESLKWELEGNEMGA